MTATIGETAPTPALTRVLMERLVSHGVPRAPLERALVDAASSQTEGVNRLSTRVAHRLIRVVGPYRSATSTPIASSVQCTDFGLPGFMLLTAPTVERGLASFARYQALVSDMVGGWRVERTSGGALLKFESPSATDELDSILLQAASTFAVAMWRDMLGSIRTRHVCFRTPPPPNWAALVRFFDCPVHFDAGEDVVAVDHEALERRPRMSNPEMYGYFEQHAEAALESRGRPEDLVDVVQGKVLSGLPHGATSESDIAHQLGMSGRTLRRKLDERGLRFRHILDHCRLRLGERLLDSDRSLTDIALSLGFSEASAFSRAFRRQRGISPRTYRARLRDRGR